MLRFVGAILLLATGPVGAQDTGLDLNLNFNDGATAPVEQQPIVRAATASGVQIRGLDKVSGDVLDIELSTGETGQVGRLEVTLGECRYPQDNPAGEAYAWLEIRDTLRESNVFAGWMIASSPALNALDHARYDVWVIRCTNA